MASLLIVIVYICVFFAIFIRLSVRKSLLSLESIFYIYFIPYSLISTLVLYFQIDSGRRVSGLDNQSILDLIIFFTLTSISIIYSINALLKRGIYKHRPIYQFENVEGSSKGIITITYAFSALAILYFVATPSPLKVLLTTGNVTDAYIARLDPEQKIDIRFVKFFIKDIIPFWMIFIFIEFVLSKGKIRKYHLLGFFIISFLMMSSNLSKGGIVYLLLHLLLAFFCIKGLSFKVIKGMILLMVTLFLMFSFMMMSESASFFSLLTGMASRATSGVIAPAYYFIEYANKEGFLWGTSLPNPRGLFPFDHFDIEVKVWELMNPVMANQGLSYRNPTVFWAEGYVNFGVLGVVLFSVFVAFIILFWDIYFFSKRRRLTTLDLSFLIWVGMHYSTLNSKSLSPYLFDISLLVTFMFYIGMRIYNFKRLK